mgnify:CR=1 FL=1
MKHIFFDEVWLNESIDKRVFIVFLQIGFFYELINND